MPVAADAAAPPSRVVSPAGSIATAVDAEGATRISARRRFTPDTAGAAAAAAPIQLGSKAVRPPAQVGVASMCVPSVVESCSGGGSGGSDGGGSSGGGGGGTSATAALRPWEAGWVGASAAQRRISPNAAAALAAHAAVVGCIDDAMTGQGRAAPPQAASSKCDAVGSIPPATPNTHHRQQPCAGWGQGNWCRACAQLASAVFLYFHLLGARQASDTHQLGPILLSLTLSLLSLSRSFSHWPLPLLLRQLLGGYAGANCCAPANGARCIIRSVIAVAALTYWAPSPH